MFQILKRWGHWRRGFSNELILVGIQDDTSSKMASRLVYQEKDLYFESESGAASKKKFGWRWDDPGYRQPGSDVKLIQRIVCCENLVEFLSQVSKSITIWVSWKLPGKTRSSGSVPRWGESSVDWHHVMRSSACSIAHSTIRQSKL